MRIPLLGGAYQSRSVISSAQRCVNLYPESNPQDSPAPVTTYPTPGLRKLVQAPEDAPVRALHLGSNGLLYGVIGPTVYLIDAEWNLIKLGTITDLPTPVSMCDNGTTIIITDGTVNAWTVDIQTRGFAVLSDAAFYGADSIDILDGFMLFNKPGTPQFYCSNNNAVTFDALYFANKNTHPDNLVAVAVVGQIIWLLGEVSTEFWFNAGQADFPFQRMPQATVNHGCVARKSVAKADACVFWVAKDKQGQGIVLMGSGVSAKRISTHAIEAEISKYGTLSDAIGYTYQQGGHLFYVLNFPGADKTWAYDLSTEMWHERMWMDNNGGEHRHRGQVQAFAYGEVVVGDWENGTLYALDLDVYEDDGAPIKRVRGFPHVIDDAKRIIYQSLTLDMEVGNASGTATDLPIMGSPLAYDGPSSLGAGPLTTDPDRFTISVEGDASTLLDFDPVVVNSVGAAPSGAGAVDGADSQLLADGGSGGYLALDPSRQWLGGDGPAEFRIGYDAGGGAGLMVDSGVMQAGPPMVMMRWSDTRGASWGTPIQQSMGAAGQYLTSIQFRRLGMARDRVFEVSWTAPVRTALNGAFLQVTECSS